MCFFPFLHSALLSQPALIPLDGIWHNCIHHECRKWRTPDDLFPLFSYSKSIFFHYTCGTKIWSDLVDIFLGLSSHGPYLTIATPPHSRRVKNNFSEKNSSSSEPSSLFTVSLHGDVIHREDEKREPRSEERDYQPLAFKHRRTL